MVATMLVQAASVASSCRHPSLGTVQGPVIRAPAGFTLGAGMETVAR
ncbi:hypothetical protein [Siccirubricoccus deserti]|uniref:Uncharacterized protein n=1 Tax=Siccirubricoccus deserti TaxID=2013562 RepID=A0A9X0R4K4_9PROT|nr:hypothetical protein [Siccirubricoccus deserti]MBC4018442.1 hypothetical protein [Siccirubricoccus deserti]